MKATDFARWAGSRAAHIQNAVTAVTTVTARENPSVPAAFDCLAPVTTAKKAAVTTVTKTGTAIDPPTPAAHAEAPLAEGHVADRCGLGKHGNSAIEPSSAALDEERAAFIGQDGHILREWAEGLARLDPDRPPGDVPPRRWQQFVDDFGRFLDSGFAEKAAAVGWTRLDLFGCDGDRPFGRIDQQGLCWLIAGTRLVDLSENAAIIETWTGARQTWHRKPSDIGRVLAWELVS